MFKITARNEALANCVLEGEGVSLEMAEVKLERVARDWAESVSIIQSGLMELVIERIGVIKYLACEGFTVTIERI